MEKLIVSIVTWNSSKTIHSCIESVLQQSYSNFTVFIVDNNSSDNTAELVEKFQDRRIKFFKKSENTGFCGGHNFNIMQSSSEFVLLVNPDIIMDPCYIERALNRIEKDSVIGTLCGLLLQAPTNSPSSRIDSAGLEKKRSGIMRLRHHGELFQPGYLVSTTVFGSDGALPLYRRAMIEDISYEGQFFDEMFFAHKEDWDISWRAHTYGWLTVFEPSCLAIHPRHFKPKSVVVRNQISVDIKVHAVKNQLILLLKNERLSSFMVNSIFIVPRQLAIFLFILLFETTSLKAYRYVLRNLKPIMAKRKKIQSHRGKLT